jgi:endonuclease-3
MKEKNWDALFARLLKTLEKEGTPLPSVSTVAIETDRDPFLVLISTLLSLRTKDTVTLQASHRLFAKAKTPQEMLALGMEKISRLIYPCGFYRRKAENIISISKVLLKEYGGAVPADQNDLMKLPGVGLKTANLTLNLGFGIDAICVDCHVHQIANRMGWVQTKTPEETERALRKIMPKKYWISLNELLVTYGQHICLSISPRCSLCSEQTSCPKIGVTHSR